MKAVSLLLLVLIRGYQLLVSPFFPPACRYLPTCSDYARQAVSTHGPLRGSWLAGRRLLRCHPWAGWGYDPVPEKKSARKSTGKSTAGLGLCPDCRHLDHQSGR
ncbi:membrane protein insertion efficiency factor YidD [Pelagibius litoralis]|uniref:Putative membrane protein insertion efficiency factor n=1 Tax=Pelagibius litoralis TaxID=374515 RepID=A0A967K9W0_9PROT|nr:membrane protein insertion efficiency factor YidD [Pelagibius litoralis]NIA71278.1 membrane protein insertion efficiency factor YidD [Pelagibius litoralis]